MSVLAPKNPNYAATVVQLKDFVELPNCDNVCHTLIFNNAVIVSKEAKAGDIGLFFPVETELSKEFLTENNLYRNADLNRDKTQKGYFEEHGRIKAVKFRGHKSEGLFMPISSLNYLQGSVIVDNLTVGAVFDRVDTHAICRKYVPKMNPAALSKARTQGQARANLEESIVPGQFRFHFDTGNLRRNIHKIQPDDFIAISDKWHGTSLVVGNLLVKRELNWLERLAIRFGIQVDDRAYGITYSSRRVIKAVNGVEKSKLNFYSDDIHGQAAVGIADRIPKGFTVYAEVVGYTSSGQEIQKGYSYGCTLGQHKTLVYRVTSTNADGLVVELTTPQMLEFCTKYGLETLPQFYYGRAGDVFYGVYGENEEESNTPEWQKEFLSRLEFAYVRDSDCPYNKKGTPAEGIVLRVDRLEECVNFKLKNFRFLAGESKELDKGVLDMETAESIEAEAVAV